MAFEAYANGWPDLKKLDELAKKIDNVPTFTSEDKQFLEDLFEEQAAAIAFDNTGTDFQSDNVEDAIKEAATMGGSGEVDYSDTERKIGKWGNDDLYETTVHVGGIATGTNVQVAHNIPNIAKVFRFWGCGITSTGTCLSVRFDTANNTVNLVSVGTTNMTWSVGSAYATGGTAEADFYAVIQYTKTPTP